jgi:isoleucyl-tRNA synthetase
MIDFKSVEADVRAFWEKKKVYEKLKKENAKGKKFYFLQGPPYTSGKLHIGHAWNSSLKDMAMRYKRMKGMDVWDRAGYDMHGLPTENAVQKKIGLNSKEEIEKYGVEKFVKECMKFSLEHAEIMNKDLWNLGVWMDYKDAYMPVKKEFIDGQWAFFKKADEQKRLYKGKKVMHWDAETETSLAKHELDYKPVKDDSIFLKFLNKGTKNVYFVIWTTTPWTIPFNLAIMVNPDLDYVKVKVENEYWIVAKDLVGAFVSGVIGKNYKIIEEFKGKKLEGREYEHPLYDNLKEVYDGLKESSKNVHTIILNKDYVDTGAGTGLVHCAPGCGPEDQEAAAKYGIDTFNTLNEKGEFEEMGKYNGMVAKRDDKKFIEEFNSIGVLLATTVVEHEYPHSWRSHEPVVFRTTEQWFLKTKDLIPTLLNYNKKVHWEPKKSGESYKRWAENLRDNGLTRQRYWACPVPIWVNGDDYIVIGSVKELEKHAGKKLDDLNLHRPWVDKIIVKKNGKEYKRIPDVSDVWIDSGTVSWNSLYNDPKLIKKYFPADLILEATEQTKLWFSLLQICSSIMFGKSSYENVFVTGMILDFQGIKMSKSLGNIISPYEVIDKFSADIFRYYIAGLTAGENVSFSWEDVKVKQRNLVILNNIANYILDLEKQKISKGKIGVEENWILSRYHTTLKKVSELYESFRLDEIPNEIEVLFMSLSRDYIKLVREKSGVNSIVLDTVKEVYMGILKMFAPICPMICESLWRKMGQKEDSIHLCRWKEVDEKKIDSKLESHFDKMFEVIEFGLKVRDKEKIGLKWPLSKAEISGVKLEKNLQEIVARQLNVKKIKLVSGTKVRVNLDLHITKELEAEGFARELARFVQSIRKKSGLEKKDVISLKVATEKSIESLLKKHSEFLKERVNAKKIDFVDGKLKDENEFVVKGKIIRVAFS